MLDAGFELDLCDDISFITRDNDICPMVTGSTHYRYMGPSFVHKESADGPLNGTPRPFFEPVFRQETLS
ncbi:hypothetical protein GCM10009067_16460 [Haloarcula sebkhae]|uniref:Uncharacterized protein n=1 Tax=Haloarcula sebkhae TaxID=932660 RepID=A0A830EPH7_9EURY|nr:hypothetical protein GCM10009067_16460 [Haloarcula sebkhae]